MFNKLKELWKDREFQEKLQVAVIITVVITLVYALVWLIAAAIGFTLNFTGLAWVLRGWIGFSFGYMIWMIVEEVREFKEDPERYGFWNGDISDDDDEPPTFT